ncbi:MAG: (E)-4-hydroxy-3-methylbut-2-enyl-diphosphate synthase [Synergistes jonesii]|uniref:(E)-4-hydroxy-3-methylbut-2-enyl-diphosphate synthase n=1 Tax=Synergistes jonesii TaxID=2754 RepID=UPI002A75C778|nr:(E)-4-hydroxy-3-methylbut-2-enyl-diphosphate synthase [Synergistes jonesii]MDY2985025.1 (E)-4-hydroxy-3-methylbut-2-enyl-diphosphate synthase [Synergistes jonesii]
MASLKSVAIKGLKIGGGAPVRVESMLKTRLADVEGCVKECHALLKAGCELARVALPDETLAPKLAELVKKTELPLMADIHFNHKLALAALSAGVPAIRINPGNMSGAAGLAEVVAAAKDRGAVIRIGANGGSVGNAQLAAAGGDRGAALVIAVEEQLGALLERGFEDVIVSAKSSSVAETVRANALLAQKYPFPLHVGITEAGCGNSGIVKGAVGIGLMLAQGMGDTIRVSLTGAGAEEVETGYSILSALALRSRGWQLISCPTCGRRRIEVAELVEKLRKIIPADACSGMTIAVMGCEVNGPKEAANADLGIAGSPEGFIIFKKGAFVCRGSMETFEETVRHEIFLTKP